MTLQDQVDALLKVVEDLQKRVARLEGDGLMSAGRDGDGAVARRTDLTMTVDERPHAIVALSEAQVRRIEDLRRR